MKELDAFSNALAIKNTTLLYHQMADRLYRWLWNWRIPRGYSKHTEASVWADFKAQSEYAFATWKNNPTKVLDNNPFTPLPKYTTITLVPVKVLILR
jgi:alpha-amylase